jgi:hypothetical protein
MADKPTVHFAKATTTVSSEFIVHVRRLFEDTLARMVERQVPLRSGFQTATALPAYISAVAAIEAFLNEVFLSGSTPPGVNAPVLAEFRKTLERIRLAEKLLLIPQLAFGNTLSTAQQPYQDMALLIQLRNELVHYKMGLKPPALVRSLAQRGLAVRVPVEQEAGGPMPWVDRVGTVHGILWAHNIACATARAVIALAPPTTPDHMVPWRFNFDESHERHLEERLRTSGLPSE